jgi:hypothetical protein
MTDEETRRVVEGYLGDQSGHWLAEEVELEDTCCSEIKRGRGEVAAWLRALTDTADARRARLTIEDGRAVVEQLSSPAFAAVFEVDAGEITRARLYYAPRLAPHEYEQ